MSIQSPLGPLAGIAGSAQEWRSRSGGIGLTLAGLWHVDQRAAILHEVQQHTLAATEELRQRWARRGVLPGIRQYATLLALLPLADELVGETEPDDNDGRQYLPVWEHGVFAQAAIGEARHAIHIVRYLDDYHEPTIASLRRRFLQKFADTDLDEAAARAAANQAAAESFLREPMRWRDVAIMAAYRAAIYEIQQAAGRRLRGPQRTVDQLRDKVQTGIGLLLHAGAVAEATRISSQLSARLETLAAARVCLLYDEHTYLQVTGIQAGRSTRRHLARGLHLIFCDYSHRRDDRIAHLWLDTSPEEQQAGAFHWSAEIPAAYAARKERAPLRVSDDAAVWRYLEGEAD